MPSGKGGTIGVPSTKCGAVTGIASARPGSAVSGVISRALSRPNSAISHLVSSVSTDKDRRRRTRARSTPPAGWEMRVSVSALADGCNRSPTPRQVVHVSARASPEWPMVTILR